MRANVWLCGPPAAGKSSAAPRLAVLLNAEALDVDALIEREAGEPVAALVERTAGKRFARASGPRWPSWPSARRGDRAGRRRARGPGQPGRGRRQRDAGLPRRVAGDVRRAQRAQARRAAAAARAGRAGALARRAAGQLPRRAGAGRRRRAELRGGRPRGRGRLARGARGARRDRRALRRGDRPGRDRGAARAGRAAARRTRRRGGRRAGRRAGPARRARLHSKPVSRPRCCRCAPTRASSRWRRSRRCTASFVAARLDRRGIVLGVGGGTIGDAVGFAAATFQRGVRYVALPTTLLAAVDAAIGGKTGINLAAGKNLVGTVTQPAHVAIAPHALRWLERRDVVSGYGEMLKYGLALDAALYRALRAGEAALLADPAGALDAIARCVELKARDRRARRARPQRHSRGAQLRPHRRPRARAGGGLRRAAPRRGGDRRDARRAGALGRARAAGRAGARRRRRALGRAARPAAVARARSYAAVAAATASDKKRHAGGTRFVLLDAIGSARLDDGVGAPELHAALARIGLGSSASRSSAGENGRSSPGSAAP